MKHPFGILARTYRRSPRIVWMAALPLLCALSLTGAVLRHTFFAMQAPRLVLSHCMPEGALLYLEAKDFGQIMTDWNRSPEKHVWVDSDNYSVFSRSRLFLRLQDAQKGFAAAAGLNPDMQFLDEVTGDQSALAVYDVGNLEFLYISRVPQAKAMQSQLWQRRAKFEVRTVGGQQFFVHQDQDSNRTVAFAVNGDYLVLATRENLAAAALGLMSGTGAHSLDQEAWFSKAVSSAGQSGDLRMVMHLEQIAVEPHFRTYWLPQNITETANYVAGVSDLYRGSDQYREERMLLRKSPEELAKAAKAKASPVPTTPPLTDDGSKAAASSLQFVPQDYGVYRVFSNPTTIACVNALQEILAPQREIAVTNETAPEVSVGNGTTGAATDLESRIDVAPEDGHKAEKIAPDPIFDFLQQANPQALLVIASSRKNSDGVLVSISNAAIIAASTDWDGAKARDLLQQALSRGLTTSHLGVEWQTMQSPQGLYRLNGLMPTAMAARGRFLIVANDFNLAAALLQAADAAKPASPEQAAHLVYSASFNHARERQNFRQLTRVLESKGGDDSSREPDFFSRNVGSISEMFAGVASESMEVHESGGQVRQTVIYRWAR